MIRSTHYPGSTNRTGPWLQSSVRPEQPALNLIFKLCQALAEEEITYCHWKSNNALDRSANGDNDLDLLVKRADGPRFAELLDRLGFRQALAPADKQMPGVLDYFGYAEDADKWIHVHVHYQLVLGHDMSKNYRLPIEQQYLASAAQGSLFKVPAPEFEFIVFVIRMALKHLAWDVILGREGKLKSAERQELAYLQARIHQNRVDTILQQYLPYISVGLFNNCIRALEPGCSTWARIKIGQQLQIQLQTNARRPFATDIGLKLWRRATLAIYRRIFKSSAKYRLASGGAMIAIVGGDGAGKSTAVDALSGWLAKQFETTHIHMGKPAWSWSTRTIRGILKIGQVLGLYPAESSFQATLNQKALVSPGYPWLLREVCRARDRYHTYVKARRFAANGGMVILDRFPLPQIKLMDGPLAARFMHQFMSEPQSDQAPAGLPGALGLLSPQRTSLLTKALVKLEESYYQPIVPPELLLVLRVDPELAVQRKTNEDAATVRTRSREIWEINWEQTEAHVIDGGQSKTAVLTEIKAFIWSRL